MNKKGNIFGAIMISLMIFMVGMIIVNFIIPEQTSSRTSIGCSAPETDGTKLLCLVLDLPVIYFMILVISLAGGLILDKTLL